MKRGAMNCYLFFFFSFQADMINYVISKVMNEVGRDHS